ncbi:MAG TPA: 50S ribosomal protein L18e [Candidatus Nanoarchaeia archaeon]|nr:50S ribosomal protein L18e [Candidatus Nanoarchaeia archaeon]
MVKRTGPTNEQLAVLIKTLRKDESGLWQRVSSELARPTRSRRAVNLSTINRNTKSGETVIIPGKVLSAGELKHKLNVAAWQFSENSIKKIKEAGGDTMTINELFEKKGKGRIIG